MELKTKELFLNTLDSLMDVMDDCGLEKDMTGAVRDAGENMPLLVPVVGEFSAGKSSLLNHLMGKNILAVAMDPETAIPAELYYSEEEYDEGVREDGESERITDLSDAAKKYVCVRRHINSQFLHDIEPVVLVDMPGFDSPLDEHNRAIFNYLERGIHYAVLIPADAGTVSKSMERQIHNILSFDKTCSFFLSRTDLRSPEEVEQVKEGLETTLSTITGEDVSIGCVSRNDVSLFDSFARALNVDELFGRQFRESVIEQCVDAKNALGTRIAALKAGSGKNQEAIGEIEKSIAKIEAKKKKLIEQARKDTYDDEADSIASEVGSSLNAELDSLVSIAKSGGSAALKQEIGSIIQSVVVSRAQSVMEEISARYGKKIVGEISGLAGVPAVSDAGDGADIDAMAGAQGSDSVISDYSSGFSEKLAQAAQTGWDSATMSVKSYIKYRQKRWFRSEGYKAITSVLAITTNFVAPIVEVLIVFLPDIINYFMSSYREKQQTEKLREAIKGKIPELKRKVRESVVAILRENSSEAISAICAKLDDELQRMKQQIEAMQKSDADDEADISAQVEKYQSAVSRIDELLAKVAD